MKKIGLPVLACAFALTLWAGDVIYTECSQIFPGQIRFTQLGVNAKIDRLIERGDIHPHSTANRWVMGYDAGRSPLPPDWALPVVKVSFGYVLVDGHHSFIATQIIGGTTVPIQVLGDYSDLDETALWETLEMDGWAYLIDLEGRRRIPPRRFEELVDDPNRFFADLIARKVGEDGDLTRSKGAQYPVWVKVGTGEPFMEFRIADVLWSQGIVYDYSMGASPPEELIETARQALVEANLSHLWIIPVRTHIQDVEPLK